MFDNSRVLELAVRWLVLAAAVWVAAELVDGIELEGLESTLIIAAILGLLNLYIRPALMFLTFPLTLITLGLFIIVLNAIMLGITDWIAGEIGGIEFAVETGGAALLGALIISVVSMVLNSFVKPARFA
jgi:putative membrane protein